MQSIHNKIWVFIWMYIYIYIYIYIYKSVCVYLFNKFFKTKHQLVLPFLLLVVFIYMVTYILDS